MLDAERVLATADEAFTALSGIIEVRLVEFSVELVMFAALNGSEGVSADASSRHVCDAARMPNARARRRPVNISILSH